MKTKIIEANNGPRNWGRFLVGRFDSEWSQRTAIEGALSTGLLANHCGWTERHLLVLDLATGEGAVFKHGGYARADLNRRHRIWVCPLFEPFLAWLYQQDVTDLEALPAMVTLTDAPFEMQGYRRQGGPDGKITVDVDPQTEECLDVLTSSIAFGTGATAADVVSHLIHAAEDGVRRPGSWERAWVRQAFGDEWLNRLEQDPEMPVFQRPKRERKP
jgi:hypothetical protein